MDQAILEIKNTVQELIDNINPRIDSICDRFTLDGVFENERIICLAEDLEALAEGIEVIKPGYGSLDLYEFHSKLEMLVGAFEEKDFALYIDIMRYELKPLLEYWSDCLKK